MEQLRLDEILKRLQTEPGCEGKEPAGSRGYGGVEQGLCKTADSVQNDCKSGFDNREEQHERAIALVENVFREMGFELFPFGVELAPELARMLRGLRNGTSKKLRYRPDRIAVHPEKGSLLVEIKSEVGTSPNFAVEVDAWDAARLWNKDEREVVYVFVDLAARSVLGAWPEDLMPTMVYVPRVEDLQRISTICPGASIKFLPSAKGSGTAFFTVKKSTLADIKTVLNAWMARKTREPATINKHGWL